jgi:glycosyltransferase involved in cell wall biosynthesis
MDACTIIAKNYVAQARVLARSFTEHHPEGRFWTLIIDDFADYIDPAQEPFETLTPADIGCEPFADMAFRYSVIELSTAVKPWLLRHLMAELGGPITYLDPDIQVFGSLEELERLAREHKLVLTPHCNQPIPDDGRRPTQIDIMIAGVYNLGYLSLAPGKEIDELLDWWEERLRRDCRVDPVYGYFVDQRWFDLTPGLVSDRAIVREPEYNVAYWNLHGRALDRDGDSYTVDGRPLAFFHFSGFDPDEPGVLSRHQNRIHVHGSPALAQILSEYAALVQGERYATAHGFPYTFDALPDGTRLDPVVRQLFAEAEESGELSASPFSPGGSEAFLEWLAVQSPGAPPGVHRLLARLYGIRADLREAFPDLNGSDLARLFQWARREGAEEVPALARLPLPEASAGRAPERSVLPHAPLWGVNVVGHFRSELGIGEAARQVITALDSAEVPVLAVRPTTQPLSRQGHSFEVSDHSKTQFPINLICVNADMLPDFAGKVGERFFADRYSVGLWFWEVSQFRAEWQRSFDLLDEVWAPSAHVADALAPVSPIPVVPMRIPVQMQAIVPRSRADLGVPEGFLFLFSFDYLSVFERKNPLAVAEAFARAFPSGGKGPSLALKCINAERDPTNHARLLAAAEEHENIQVIDRYLEPADKDSLMALCDCYVSLHRSEGFGLTMAEAMFLGKPVIATGYSGNLDFMTDDNSLLVDHALVPIGPGLPPYPADGDWADPSVDHAATLMQLVVEDRSAAEALGARAAEDIHRTHSPETAGEMMRRRLEHVQLPPGSYAAAGDKDGTPRVAAALGTRVQRGPVARGQGASSRVVNRIARRGAMRLMRPFTAYQERVNGEIVSSLESIESSLESTDDELAGLGDRLTSDSALIQARLRSLERLSRLPAIVEAHGRSVNQLKDTLFDLGARVDGLEQEGSASVWQTDRSLYTALATLRERHEAVRAQPDGSGRDGPLTPFELRVFSQNGEDGVLAEILTRIGSGGRYFVEFGAETGAEANCAILADVLGWSGLFMDCDDRLYPELERKYRANEGVRTVKAMVAPDNLQELLDAAGAPLEPDVFCIDVDGADYWIWDSLERYRPRVIVIEYNSSLDPLRKLVQPVDAPAQWDGSDYYGASLGALRALGERKGYRLVHTELCGVNAFFVREDLAGGRFPAAEDVAVRGLPNYYQRGHHHPPHEGPRTYFDLDSGTLVDVDADTE